MADVDLDWFEISMKPLLGLAVKEAVKLALIDCIPPLEDEDAQLRRREELLWDIHKITDEDFAGIDPTALAQNVACRLLGKGGWSNRGVYSGNATPTEILHSCIERPDQDPNGDIKFALGLRPESET